MTPLALLIAGLLGAGAPAADVPLEYRVKAAYLFNFTKFVEWPEEALPPEGQITICVAGTDPFGGALIETVRGESVDGHALAARTVTDVAGCHVLFVPADVPAAPLLGETRTRPVLTVGESPGFLEQGGIVNFILHDGKVRFQISHDAATRAQLRISSRLLRLSRGPEKRP